MQYVVVDNPARTSTNISQVVADAGVDLQNINVGREVSGRKIENLISGVDRSTNSVAQLDLSPINNVRHSANENIIEAELVNKIAQLDVGALLNAGAQGQGAAGQSQGQTQQQGQSQNQAPPQSQTSGQRPTGPSDINTNNVGADLANQVAAGNRPTVGTGDINTSDVGADLANQVAGFGIIPAAQGQTPGQAPAAGQAQPAPQAQAAEAARPSAEPQPAPQAGSARPAAEAQMSGQGQNQGLRPAGPSDINTSNIAGDLANQLAPGTGVSGQRPASNDIAGDLANELAGGGASTGQNPQGQGQVAAAQSGRTGAGAVIIEIKSTVIQEANGQQLATAVVEPGQGQQAAAPAAPAEAPAMTAPQPPAAPAPPAEAQPTMAPAAMPAPAEPQGGSTAAGAAPQPETKPTQPPAEGMSRMVRITPPAHVPLLTQVIGLRSCGIWNDH